MNLTLLEVSLDDADITANAPFSGKGSAESALEGDADETDASIEVEPGTPSGDAGGPSKAPIGLAVGVLALLAIAAIRRRRRSRDESIDVE